MEDSRKMRILLLVSGAAFASMVVLLFLLPIVHGYLSERILLMFVMVIIWICALIAAVSFTEDGWEVKGTTGEWIISAAINPGWTLLMYLSTKKKTVETIDLDDVKRLDNL